MRLSWLKTFYETICKPNAELAGGTTTVICERYIKPTTKKLQCSMCDLLKIQEPNATGRASVFISHAWKYKFSDVVEALLYYFQGDYDRIIWFDLFSNNQHKAPNLTFEWWCNTFKTAIGSFEKTVMVLSPWNDPIPLKRGWCIWELYCTVETKRQFDVAMTPSAELQFYQAIEESPHLASNHILATIDCANSECFKETDRERIYSAIEKSVGFISLNSMICGLLKTWMLQRCQREVEKRLNRYGMNHIDTISSMETLARILIYERRFKEAEGLARDALRYHKMKESEDRIIFAMTLLGEICLELNNPKESEEFFQAVYDKHVRKNGKRHITALRCLANLGLIALRQTDYNKAEKLLAECVYTEEGSNSVEGCDYSLIPAISNLGIVYMNQGKYDKAEPLFLCCLHNREKIDGYNHPETMISVHHLAEVYIKQKYYKNAEQFLLRCYKQRVRTIGISNPTTQSTMIDLLNVYDHLNDNQAVESLLHDYYYTEIQQLGAPSTQSINQLYTYYMKNNNIPPLKRFIQEGYSLSKQIRGENDSETLQLLSKLADITEKSGDIEEAERLYCQCLDLRTFTLGVDHPATIQSMFDLAVTYHERNKLEESIPIYELYIKQQRLQYEETSYEVWKGCNNLSIVYRSLNRFNDTLPLHEACVKQQKVLKGEEHIDTLNAMQNLYLIYRELNMNEEAEEVMLECFEKRRRVLGDSDTKTIASLELLSQLYIDLARYHKAYTLLDEFLPPEEEEAVGLSEDDPLSSLRDKRRACDILRITDPTFFGDFGNDVIQEDTDANNASLSLFL